MVITEQFVYLHMPKTGGTFVETVLRELLSTRDTLYYDTSNEKDRILFESKNQHEKFSEVPEPYRSKKVLFTVRNPYDHLVSFYEFLWWRNHPGDTFDENKIREVYPHYPEISFQEYLEALNNWDLMDRGYVDSKTANICKIHNIGSLTLDYIRFLFQEPQKIVNDINYYFTDDRYQHELPEIFFIHTDNLNRGLYGFLLGMGYDSAHLDFILNLKKIVPPVSRRNPQKNWEEYYTPVLKSLVREKERFVFDMFPHFKSH
jgi:hypothetical protein